MVVKKPEGWALKLIALLLVGLIIFLPLDVYSVSAVPKGESKRPDGYCLSDSDCKNNSYSCSLKKDGLINDACCPEDTVWNFYTKQCEGICVDKDRDGFGLYPDPACKFKEQIDCDDTNLAINPNAEEICNNKIDDNCNEVIDEFNCSISPQFPDDSDNYSERPCLRDQCMNGDNDCDGEYDIGCPNEQCKEIRNEICNGKDDDCDGVVDDGCTSYCSKCGDGLFNLCDAEECKQLGDECVFHDGGWLFFNTCTGKMVPPPKNCVPEVCNRIDDDCDLAVDEECYPEEGVDIDAMITFIEQMNQYYDKECGAGYECGLMLLCKKGSPKNICCFQEESVVSGECKDQRRLELDHCDEDGQCQSEHCSKPVEGFWSSLTGPGAEALKNIVRVSMPVRPDSVENAIDAMFASGICCNKSTDYNTATNSCIAGGTFTLKNSTEYCKEKKLHSYACANGEGNCQYDDECIGGSYCSGGKNFNVCCPKGTKYDGSKCAETAETDCSKCTIKWWQFLSRCSEDTCLSIGQNCEFDQKSKTCKNKQSLKHDEGNCNIPGSDKLCYASPKEEMRCSVNDKTGYGVCCYPWEEQNPETGRCRTACKDGDEFCDLDKDYYSSEVELRYGSNPSLIQDTPNVRVFIEECHSPFDYNEYKYVPSNDIIMLALNTISSFARLFFDNVNLIASTILSFFVDIDVEKQTSITIGRSSGFATGATYGLMDDINFAVNILPPVLMSNAVSLLFEKRDEVLSKNNESEANLAEEYADEQIDESLRNDIFSKTSQLSYESYDFLLKPSDRNSDEMQKCYRMIYTKTFTSGFFGGYVLEQVLLLGKIGGFLFKAGAKTGSVALKIAGRTFKFLDNPIGYGIITPIKDLALAGKAIGKFGPDGIKEILKGSDRNILTALEMVKVISSNKQVWDGLTADQFKNMLKNFAEFKEGMIKSLGESAETVTLANKIFETSAGRKILIEAWGQGGWSAQSAKALAEAISKKINIDEAFKALNTKQLKSVGNELSGVIAKDGEDAAKQILRSTEDLSSFIRVATGSELISNDVVKLFDRGASREEIVRALKSVKAVKQGTILIDVEQYALREVPLKEFYGHTNKDIRTILSRASHQQQLDPIEAARVGDKYLIYDGVGRTTRAVLKGETKVDVLIMREYDSVEQMKLLAKTDEEARLNYKWWTERAVRIDSKETMDLLGKAADEVIVDAGKAADEFEESFRAITKLSSGSGGPGGDNILKGKLRDYPYLGNINQNLKEYGASVKHEPLLDKTKYSALYSPSTRTISYSTEASVGDLMHELRHFAQHRARGFKIQMSEWHINILKGEPFLKTDEAINNIVKDLNSEELDAFLWRIEEFDAWSYTKNNYDVFAWHFTKSDADTELYRFTNKVKNAFEDPAGLKYDKPPK